MSLNKDEIPQEEPSVAEQAAVKAAIEQARMEEAAKRHYGLAETQQAPEPRPSVGRIVHFAPPGSMTGSAAIITAVHDEVTVDLVVFQPGLPGVPGMNVMKGDRHAVEQRRWYWPPREA